MFKEFINKNKDEQIKIISDAIQTDNVFSYIPYRSYTLEQIHVATLSAVKEYYMFTEENPMGIEECPEIKICFQPETFKEKSLYKSLIYFAHLVTQDDSVDRTKRFYSRTKDASLLDWKIVIQVPQHIYEQYGRENRTKSFLFERKIEMNKKRETCCIVMFAELIKKDLLRVHTILPDQSLNNIENKKRGNSINEITSFEELRCSISPSATEEIGNKGELFTNSNTNIQQNLPNATKIEEKDENNQLEQGGTVEKKSIVVHNNTNSVYDKMAQKGIVNYLTNLNESGRNVFLRYLEKSGQSYNEYETVFYLNKEYHDPHTNKFIPNKLIYRKTVEEAYNDALNFDDEYPSFIRIWKSDGVTNYVACIQAHIFGDYVGDKYDDKGNLKQEVKQKAIDEIKNSLMISSEYAEGGELKTKKIIRRNLPVNKQYKLIDSFYTGGLTENPMTCENCGRPIANVAVIKDEDGKSFDVGMDCAETLSSIKNSIEFMDVAGNFQEATAIRNKIKKALKDGATIEIKNVYFTSAYYISGVKGEFNTPVMSANTSKDFFNKYLPDLKKYIVNPEKNNFYPKYFDNYPFNFNFDYFKDKVVQPKEFVIDDYTTKVSRIDKPNYADDGTIRNINNTIQIDLYKSGSHISTTTTYMHRDVPSKIISEINKYEFDNYSDSESFENGGDLREIQFGDYVEIQKDSEETRPNGFPIYSKGVHGHVENIITNDKGVFYTIKQGLTSYYDVPASDVVLYKKEKREQVEEILNERQKTKVFKDVGNRITGSKKEKLALNSTITFQDLSSLETDELTAMKSVVKERVFPEVNIQEQKDMGVSSGAVYIKVETRKACGSAPPNNPKKRASYVKFINKFSTDTMNLKKVSEIKAVYDSYLNWNAVEVIGYFVDPDFFNISDEKKQFLQQEFEKRFKYSGRIVIKQLVTEIFGKRLANFMFRNSDTASATWREAEEFEPISLQESELLISKYKEYKERDISINQKKLDGYTNANDVELKLKLNTEWSFTGFYKKELLKDLEQFRRYATKYYSHRITSQKEALTKIPEYIKQHDNNWDWYEKAPERKQVERSKERQINSGIPLSFIKRIGGISITEEYVNKTADSDLSKNPITGDFGFKTVQFGQSVSDKSAKEHIRHLLGAMSDLSEILNIDIKALNKIGGLSIAFATRGTGKALATYESGRKIINITNKRGDGTIAHEYFHYIDNSLTTFGKQGISLQFGTDNPENIQNPVIAQKMKDITNFILKGKFGITTPTKQVFQKIFRSNDYVPEFYSRKTGHKKVTLLATIEQTIDNLREEYPEVLSTSYQYPTLQNQILGYIVNAFGLNDYEIPLAISSSNYYYDCNRMKSGYWVSIHELFARASETFIFDKLEKVGRFNNYLVNNESFTPVLLSDGTETNVYPVGAEREYLFELYDSLIEAMKEQYNMAGFSPVSNKREDEYLVLEENQSIDENVDAGIVVDAKTDEVEEVIHDNVEVISEKTSDVELTTKDYEEAIEGAKTLLEFTEGQEKQDLLDYIESLETMISIGV